LPTSDFILVRNALDTLQMVATTFKGMALPEPLHL
jgi:hypothetical protein